jgi:hypothetical protein
MKAREDRKPVCIPARLFADARWSDVCIRNISARGMLLQAQQPPKRGSYLEVRRGDTTIIARVVWTSAQRFGVRTQDFVPLAELLQPVGSITKARAPAANCNQVERRRVSRSAQEQERQRQRGKAFEFAALASGGLAAGMVVVSLLQAALMAPAAAILEALN